MEFTVDDKVVTIDVAGIPRGEWAALVDAHPPRPGGKDYLWNDATFPPALIAACTGKPIDVVREWWDESAEYDGDALFEECLRVAAPGSSAWAVQRLRKNPRRLAEVRAATRLGMGTSAFLALPNDDQDLLIALLEVEGDVCPGGCGAANDQRQDPTAYTVGSVQCLWCQQTALARAEVPDDQKAFTHIVLRQNGGVR